MHVPVDSKPNGTNSLKERTLTNFVLQYIIQYEPCWDYYLKAADIFLNPKSNIEGYALQTPGHFFLVLRKVYTVNNTEE